MGSEEGGEVSAKNKSSGEEMEIGEKKQSNGEHRNQKLQASAMANKREKKGNGEEAKKKWHLKHAQQRHRRCGPKEPDPERREPGRGGSADGRRRRDQAGGGNAEKSRRPTRGGE